MKAGTSECAGPAVSRHLINEESGRSEDARSAEPSAESSMEPSEGPSKVKKIERNRALLKRVYESIKQDRSNASKIDESIDTTSPNFGLKEIDAYIAAGLIGEGQDVETDPVTLREVLNSPFKTQWLKAMDEELQSLLQNDTWNEASSDEIKNTSIIGSRWVFKTKLNPDGSTRFKARLVIKGYQQVKGVDFSETFAPVSKLSTLRMLLAFTSQHNWRIDHLDVVTAFLNPKIDKDDVYMELPEGNCNVRSRGSLSHYLVYSESPSRWCSLAIILLMYLHHNLLFVSNRSIRNTYRLVTLAVLTEIMLYV
jgi:hypothetical protein